MSPENIAKKYSPPYIAIRSFYRLIEILQTKTPLPGRIDRSFLDPDFSGSSSIQMMAAIRFLNLVDADNKPTPKLRFLVDAQGEEKTRRYREVCTGAFGPVFSCTAMDLTTATRAQLEEFFKEQYGVDGDVQRKCIKFFITLAAKSAIPLSPHITDNKRNGHNGGSSRAPVKKVSSKPLPPVEVPKLVKVPTTDDSLIGKLLDKFPQYDVSWTEQQKAAWLEGFNVFMQKIYPETKR